MSTHLIRSACLILTLVAAVTAGPDWPHYGGGPDQTRYSPLTQITPANVKNLQAAWSYDTHDAFDGSEMQCQPVVAHGVLYATSPKLRVFALNAATGEQLWSFDPNQTPRTSRTRIRGLMYFERGDERRIYFADQHWLYALDAKTGRKIEKFGNGGRIDLRQGFEGRDPSTLSVGVNTPGVFYRNLLILGSIVPESLPSAPGDIRAFDVDSGKEVWSFHTIPHPGEFGYDTWPPDAWKYSGGVNAWAGISLDEKRGYVYASTGSASYDFYGANRTGDDLFANTVLCLRADTGQRVWHFQAVKHDLLDRDFPAPPSLITIQRDGRSIDVVSQTTKYGRVWVLDRDTGKPIFPVEELHPPASDLPGEHSSPTQILPTLPPPFTRQHFTEDLITKRTPEAEKAVREQWGKFRNRGEFDPPSLQGTILFPGMDGGAEWGGTAFDPKSGLLYVNANEMAWRVKVVERKMPDGAPTNGKELYERFCASCHRADMKGTPPEFPSLLDIGARKSVDDVEHVVQYGAGRMPGHPELHGAVRRAIVNYVLTGKSDVVRGDAPTPFDLRYTLDGYIRFTDPQGFPAVTPPWGTLTAIDMNHASIAWQVPLGEVPGSGLTNTGSENYGGPVVTASGLVFIAATNYDKKFRAFDAKTGKVLWETTLPAAGNATPAVYEVNGKEYVVIGAGGGKWGAPSGGTYVAFALAATEKGQRE